MGKSKHDKDQQREKKKKKEKKKAEQYHSRWQNAFSDARMNDLRVYCPQGDAITCPKEKNKMYLLSRDSFDSGIVMDGH